MKKKSVKRAVKVKRAAKKTRLLWDDSHKIQDAIDPIIVSYFGANRSSVTQVYFALYYLSLHMQQWAMSAVTPHGKEGLELWKAQFYYNATLLSQALYENANAVLTGNVEELERWRTPDLRQGMKFKSDKECVAYRDKHFPNKPFTKRQWDAVLKTQGAKTK